MLAALRHKLAYGSDRWNTRQNNPAETYGYRLWRLIVSNSFLYRGLIKIARLLQRPFVGKDNMIEKMAVIGSGWTDERNLPPIARRTFTEMWEEKYRDKQPSKPIDDEEEIK